MMRNVSCLFLLGFCTLSGVFGQDVTGVWKTVDDQTGETKALVRVFTKGERLFGQVVEVLVKGVEDPLCRACEGKRKNEPIEGMTIIDGLQPDGDLQWKGDQLLDPEKGRWYRCKIWIDPDEPDILKVRGYLAFFYRTQRWYRQSD